MAALPASFPGPSNPTVPCTVPLPRSSSFTDPAVQGPVRQLGAHHGGSLGRRGGLRRRLCHLLRCAAPVSHPGALRGGPVHRPAACAGGARVSAPQRRAPPSTHSPDGSGRASTQRAHAPDRGARRLLDANRVRAVCVCQELLTLYIIGCLLRSRVVAVCCRDKGGAVRRLYTTRPELRELGCRCTWPFLNVREKVTGAGRL